MWIAEAFGVLIASAGVFMIHVPTGFIATGAAIIVMIEANA